MTFQTAALINAYFVSLAFTGSALYNHYLLRRDRKLKAAVGPDGVTVMVPIAEAARMEAERERQRRAEMDEAWDKYRQAAGRWYRPTTGLLANWDSMTDAEREQVYRRAMDESNARARANRQRRTDPSRSA